MDKYKIAKEVGLRCAIARQNAKFSQKDMARMLHTTQQNISYFENGENNSVHLLVGYIAICPNMRPFFEYVLKIQKEIEDETNSRIH